MKFTYLTLFRICFFGAAHGVGGGGGGGFLAPHLSLNRFKEGVLQIKHFFTSNISCLPNPIFLLLLFIFRFVYILGTHSLQKEDWQNQSHLEAATRGVL